MISPSKGTILTPSIEAGWMELGLYPWKEKSFMIYKTQIQSQQKKTRGENKPSIDPRQASGDTRVLLLEECVGSRYHIHFVFFPCLFYGGVIIRDNDSGQCTVVVLHSTLLNFINKLIFNPVFYDFPIDPECVTEIIHQVLLEFVLKEEGWRVKNAELKQAEKVASGSVTPLSVPATLAV
jgi:hypothetical protein